jgi:hypothetical protein
MRFDAARGVRVRVLNAGPPKNHSKLELPSRKRSGMLILVRSESTQREMKSEVTWMVAHLGSVSRGVGASGFGGGTGTRWRRFEENCDLVVPLCARFLAAADCAAVVALRCSWVARGEAALLKIGVADSGGKKAAAVARQIEITARERLGMILFLRCSFCATIGSWLAAARFAFGLFQRGRKLHAPHTPAPPAQQRVRAVQLVHISQIATEEK